MNIYSPETYRTVSEIKECLNAILDEIRRIIQKKAEKYKIENIDYTNFDMQSVEIVKILTKIIKKFLKNNNENLLSV